MQFNNSQSGYQNFIPVYGNPSTTTPYYYQQPEDPETTTNLMASNIPEDSFLYDMYDSNHAVIATTARTSSTPIIPSQPSSPLMSLKSSRAEEEDATAAGADRKRPKRKQVKNACVNCQKACKKCDDGRPCQRCIKLGLTATCTNSPRKERKKGVKRGPYKKRQHLDGVHDDNLSKFSDWEEGGSCSEFVPYAISEVPSMYNHHQVSSSQVAPLLGSPLSSNASFSYLSYGVPSATAAADASSASGASLSPVSPHFPSNGWEDYNHHHPYSAAQQSTATPTTSHHHPAIDEYLSYPESSAIVDNLGYDMPYRYSAQPVHTTATISNPEEQDYLYSSHTGPVVPATVPSTFSWTTYSNCIEKQQQQPAEKQPPSAGYWQTFLATA